MKVLAIITARANSRGVPGKNIRMLLDKPVIAYTMEAALAAQRVDRVVVSTDDPRIEPLCQQHQIPLINRPPELAGDTSPIDDALRHVCTHLDHTEGYRPDAVVLLYANVPIRAEGIIDRAIHELERTQADSIQSFSPVGKFHPFWLYQIDAEGRANKYIENTIYRRQELPPVYSIDGAVAVIRYECLMRAAGNPDHHAFWGQDRRGITQPSGQTVDIDSDIDFFLAEAILRHRQTQKV